MSAEGTFRFVLDRFLDALCVEIMHSAARKRRDNVICGVFFHADSAFFLFLEFIHIEFFVKKRTNYIVNHFLIARFVILSLSQPVSYQTIDAWAAADRNKNNES